MTQHRDRVGRERDEQRTRIPVIEERARVEKRTLETGRVRVGLRHRRTTRELHAELGRREVIVESVPKDELLEQRPAPRQEGETFIFPVAEEVLVRRWRLVEEVHVRASEQTRDDVIPVELDRQEVVVERSAADRA